MAEVNETSPGQDDEKIRILVVDDSRLVRASANKALADKFDLVFAEDGEEAWESLGSDPGIQVIFTDLGMPRLDGYGLIQRVRQTGDERIRNLPIIVITGASEEDGIRRKVFAAGATDFITKPFKSTELIARAEAHATYRRDKEQLQSSADIDVLTGTLNATGLNTQLEKDVSFVNRHAEHLAIILFELDNFKSLYERLGQELSNRIIKAVASTLSGAIRKEDSVGRYGLEKFMVVLPMAKTEGVIMLAKRLCAKVESFKMTMGGQPVPITMSAGICAIKKGSRVPAKNLVSSAELALRNARKVGIGEVQILKSDSGSTGSGLLPASANRTGPLARESAEHDTKAQINQALECLEAQFARMSKEQRQRLIALAQAGAEGSLEPTQ